MMKKLLNIFLVAIFLVGLVAPAAFADATSVPVISGLEDVTVIAGNEVYVKITVTDEDGDRTLLKIYNLAPEATWEQVDEENYELIWTTTLADVGVHEFGFVACDDYSACTRDSLRVTVLEDVPVDYQAIYENYQALLLNYQEEYDDEVIPMYQEAMCSGDEEEIRNVVTLIEEGIVNLFGYVDVLDTFSDEADEVGQDEAALNLVNLASDFATLAHDAEALISEPFDESVCETPIFEDADGDRIVDSEDNCPTMANPDQADADGDGIGDVCELSDVEDADADSIVDSLDNCPLVANADQLDTDADLIGDVCDLDDDADGIVDTLDNCPLVANADQLDTDADLIGDVCDTGDDPVDEPVTYKDQYNDLKDEYEAFEDDYQYNKKKYNNAVEDDDEDDIEKYQDKLEELDDDLKDLDDDVENLIDDVESEDDVNENLVDDLEELEDDIENLREKIDNVLNGEDDNVGYVYESTYVPPKSTSSDEPAVVIEQLDFANLNQANQEPVNSWDNVRYLVWLIAGIVVLIAVLLFFLALLLG